jgi:transcriptional regulator with XRE-family HTH domain
MADPAVGDLRDDIAQRLDAMREDKGWSLSELAQRAGVKLGILSALHRGQRKGRNMKLGVAAQLCDALGTQVGRDLLLEEHIPWPLPDGVDLGQLSQREKEDLIIQLVAEFLRRGFQIPPVQTPRSDDGREEP